MFKGLSISEKEKVTARNMNVTQGKIYWEGRPYGKGSKSITFKTSMKVDFSGGQVVKNPPAKAVGEDLILGPGRSHLPWSN